MSERLIGKSGGNAMKKIYKYTLEAQESNILELPLSTQILSVENNGEDIVLYGLVDTEEQETTNYDIRAYGTGHEVTVDVSQYSFLGTVKMYNGLVFHIWYKRIIE